MLERPVLVLGNGVHLAGAEDEARELVEHLGIPVVSSWLGADIVPTESQYYIGRFGIYGDRASNFAVQAADAMIIIGCGLTMAQTGYDPKKFAPNAKKRVFSDAKRDIPALLSEHWRHSHDKWLAQCQKWKKKYVVSNTLVDYLSEMLPDDAIVVTDMGMAFTTTFQAAKMKLGQRWFTASGFAPMGYGLPGAIGAYYATGKAVTCIVGDGGLMFNIASLQTIGERMLPITVYVLVNGGYLTMKNTQLNHFGRLVGTDMGFPTIQDLSKAFGVELDLIESDELQPPRVMTIKNPDGTLQGGSLENMYPYITDSDFEALRVS